MYARFPLGSALLRSRLKSPAGAFFPRSLLFVSQLRLLANSAPALAVWLAVPQRYRPSLARGSFRHLRARARQGAKAPLALRSLSRSLRSFGSALRGRLRACGSALIAVAVPCGSTRAPPSPQRSPPSSLIHRFAPRRGAFAPRSLCSSRRSGGRVPRPPPQNRGLNPQCALLSVCLSQKSTTPRPPIKAGA